MPIRRQFIAPLTAVAVAALIVGCGGGAPSSDSTAGAPTVTVTRTVVETSSVPSGATTTATTTRQTGTTTSTTETSTTVALGAECTASDLKPSYLGSNGAAGTIELGFALTNTGSTTCHTYGFPGVEFLTAQGAGLPTNPTRSTGDMAGAAPELLLNLKPGQAASFRLLASDFSSGGGSCATAAQLQIYAPDDTVAMSVALAGGVPACGKTSVSPMQPGTSAYASQ